MSQKLKKILNFVLIFGTLAIVLIIGFSGNELGSAVTALKSIHVGWIALCVAAYACFVAIDAASIHFFLRRHDTPISYSYALFVSISGSYYSNITPGATGGQPMQVYYMKKQGVPIGIGTAAITVKFFCFQLMLQVIATVGWLTNGPFIAQQLSGNMWILVVGYIYNAFCVGLVVMMAVSKRLVRFVVNLFIKAGTKLRICKDPEASRARWGNILETFHSSVMMVARNPMDLIVQLLLGGAQLLVQTAIIFFVYLAFHLDGTSCWQIIAMGVLQYISAAYTPLPGASGAQEGVFALYFAGIFPDGIHFMALLLWRFFTYYLSLAVGAVVTLSNGFRKKAEKPPEEAENPS